MNYPHKQGSGADTNSKREKSTIRSYGNQMTGLEKKTRDVIYQKDSSYSLPLAVSATVQQADEGFLEHCMFHD